MAKRSKYSTALFEVITNARKPEKPLGKPRGVVAVATPNGWFRGRMKALFAAAEAAPEPPPAPYDAEDPTARITASGLAARVAIRAIVPFTWTVGDGSADAPAADAESAAVSARDSTAALAEETARVEPDASPVFEPIRETQPD